MQINSKKAFSIINLFSSRPPQIKYKIRDVSSFVTDNRALMHFSDDLKAYCSTIKSDLEKEFKKIDAKIQKKVEKTPQENSQNINLKYNEYKRQKQNLLKEIDSFTDPVQEKGDPNEAYDLLEKFTIQQIENINQIIMEIYNIK